MLGDGLLAKVSQPCLPGSNLLWREVSTTSQRPVTKGRPGWVVLAASVPLASLDGSVSFFHGLLSFLFLFFVFIFVFILFYVTLLPFFFSFLLFPQQACQASQASHVH